MCSRKVPSSPRCPSVATLGAHPAHPLTSPKPGPLAPVPQGGAATPRGRQPSLTSQMAARALNTSQYSEPCTSLSPLCHDQPSLPLQVRT